MPIQITIAPETASYPLNSIFRLKSNPSVLYLLTRVEHGKAVMVSFGGSSCWRYNKMDICSDNRVYASEIESLEQLEFVGVMKVRVS